MCVIPWLFVPRDHVAVAGLKSHKVGFQVNTLPQTHTIVILTLCYHTTQFKPLLYTSFPVYFCTYHINDFSYISSLRERTIYANIRVYSTTTGDCAR